MDEIGNLGATEIKQTGMRRLLTEGLEDFLGKKESD